MRLPVWTLIVGLQGCSLAGEARYFRPLPSSDVATSDAAASDGDATDALEPDGATPGDAAMVDAAVDATVDGGSTCVRIGPELCNGLDDDCDGVRDNVPTAMPPLDCVAPPRVPGGPPRLGEYRGCSCEPINAPENCGNGLDDNGDGLLDEGCECDAMVVPSTVSLPLMTLPAALGIFPTVADALSRLPATGQRKICLLAALDRTCSTRARHAYDIRVPADVMIRGGYVPAVVPLRPPELLPTCPSDVVGTITYANSNTRSVVSNVRVSASLASNGAAVSMPGDGWFVDSAVDVRATGLSVNATAISADGTGLHRIVRNVNLALTGAAQVTGLFATRGRIWANQLQINAQSGRTIVGVDLDRAAASLLDGVSVTTLNAGELIEGVHLSEPLSYVAINGLSGAAGAAPQARGLTIDCRDGSPATVQVANANWRGSLAPDSIGALVRGCHAEFSSPTVASSIVSSSLTTAASAASTATALRCELGARCVTLAGDQPLTFRAVGDRNGAVATARGASIATGASAAILATTIDGAGAASSSIGVDMDGRVLYALNSTIIGGGAPDLEASISLRIRKATDARVAASIIRAERGVGVAIDAEGVDGMLLFANTITAISGPNTNATRLMTIRGARAAATIYAENNLFACSNLAPPVTLAFPSVGLSIDGAPPFGYFAYNMIGGCQTPVLVGADVLSVGPLAQARLSAAPVAAGALLIPTSTLALDPTNGWKLTASSPAVGRGSPLVLTAGARDFEGQARGPLAPPDIGADER